MPVQGHFPTFFPLDNTIHGLQTHRIHTNCIARCIYLTPVLYTERIVLWAQVPRECFRRSLIQYDPSFCVLGFDVSILCQEPNAHGHVTPHPHGCARLGVRRHLSLIHYTTLFVLSINFCISPCMQDLQSQYAPS